MQRLKKGDKVRVISGSFKGKEGTILELFPKNQTAIVEGINVRKKHQKPNQEKDEGGIVDVTLPIALCKLGLVDHKSKGKVSRVKFGYDKDNKKVRIARLSNTEIGKK